MNRTCLLKKSILHDQNQHARSIRTVKTNIDRTNPPILKFVLVAIAVLISVNIINAQNGGGFKNTSPEQRAEFLTNWMETELMLDSTLVSSVYDINLNYARKNQSVMNSGARKLDKYKQIKASSDAKDKELQKIFSKEQYKEYMQKKEEMKEKMKQRFQENRKSR